MTRSPAIDAGGGGGAKPLFRSPLVGNDVVDLEDREAVGAHLRDRFVQRVLAAEERERLGGDPEPHLRLWAYFAAKEAAYKVAVKKRPGTIFAHRRFLVAPEFDSVRFDDLHLSLRLSLGEGFVHAVAFEGDGFVGGGAPRWGVAQIDGDDPSAAVRRGLCAGVGRELDLDPDELQVIRDPVEGSWDGRGPPRIVRGAQGSVDNSLRQESRPRRFREGGNPVRTQRLSTGGPRLRGGDHVERSECWAGNCRQTLELPLDVSLSHHGRFVAWAFLLQR